MDNKTRCAWLDGSEIYTKYHDEEWGGEPVHDDNKLFEMLILEGMQAGLSWITILKKREAFRVAFDDFDPNRVANYDENKVEELMSNEKIIRNRRKITAAINNAKLFLTIQDTYGSFDRMIWEYVDNTPIIGHWNSVDEMPASTPLSDKISRDLKKMGFKFTGSTIIYSFMQATGMVNDHTTDCFCYARALSDKSNIRRRKL